MFASGTGRRLERMAGLPAVRPLRFAVAPRVAQSGAEMDQTCREFFALTKFGWLLSDRHQRKADGCLKDPHMPLHYRVC